MYSQIASHDAELKELAIPTTPPVPLQMQTALTPEIASVKAVWMLAWWTEQRSGDPFRWPLLIHMYPQSDTPPNVPALLGLGGVISDSRWTFDGTYHQDSRHGFLTLNDIR